MKHDIPKAALTPGGNAPASHYPSGLARPYLHPHRLAGATRDWCAIDAYARDAIDTGEWLRSRARPTPLNAFSLGASVLMWATLFACMCAIAGGIL